MILSASKYTPLETLKAIRENSYRTKCGELEYCPEEVDDLINEKETKKLIKQIEQQFKKVV